MFLSLHHRLGLSAPPIIFGLLIGGALLGGSPMLDAASIRDGNFTDMAGGMPLTQADSYGKTAYLYSYCQW